MRRKSPQYLEKPEFNTVLRIWKTYDALDWKKIWHLIYFAPENWEASQLKREDFFIIKNTLMQADLDEMIGKQLLGIIHFRYAIPQKKREAEAINNERNSN